MTIINDDNTVFEAKTASNSDSNNGRRTAEFPNTDFVARIPNNTTSNNSDHSTGGKQIQVITLGLLDDHTLDPPPSSSMPYDLQCTHIMTSTDYTRLSNEIQQALSNRISNDDFKEHQSNVYWLTTIYPLIYVCIFIFFILFIITIHLVDTKHLNHTLHTIVIGVAFILMISIRCIRFPSQRNAKRVRTYRETRAKIVTPILEQWTLQLSHLPQEPVFIYRSETGVKVTALSSTKTDRNHNNNTIFSGCSCCSRPKYTDASIEILVVQNKELQVTTMTIAPTADYVQMDHSEQHSTIV